MKKLVLLAAAAFLLIPLGASAKKRSKKPQLSSTTRWHLKYLNKLGAKSLEKARKAKLRHPNSGKRKSGLQATSPKGWGGKASGKRRPYNFRARLSKLNLRKNPNVQLREKKPAEVRMKKRKYGPKKNTPTRKRSGWWRK